MPGPDRVRATRAVASWVPSAFGARSSSRRQDVVARFQPDSEMVPLVQFHYLTPKMADRERRWGNRRAVCFAAREPLTRPPWTLSRRERGMMQDDEEWIMAGDEASRAPVL